jgi:uncharacterized membrane protein
MRIAINRLLILSCLALAASCAQSDGIDTSGAIYEGVSPEARITLTGTEPFWGLELTPQGDGEYEARFTSPEDIDGSLFSATRFAGNNGLGFSGTLGGKPVQVALTPGDCSDGMSDRSYPFTTTVGMGEATLFGCAYTSDAPFTGPEAP